MAGKTTSLWNCFQMLLRATETSFYLWAIACILEKKKASQKSFAFQKNIHTAGIFCHKTKLTSLTIYCLYQTTGWKKGTFKHERVSLFFLGNPDPIASKYGDIFYKTSLMMWSNLLKVEQEVYKKSTAPEVIQKHISNKLSSWTSQHRRLLWGLTELG